MKTLIVDDEAPARSRLRRALACDERVEIVGEAENGEKAIELIEALCPELVFLDIQMPGMTGFDVLRLLSGNERQPKVVFVTAHDEFAVQAFELAAADYLLKPYSDDRLRQTLDRVSSRNIGVEDQVLDSVETPEFATRLPVRHLKRVRLIDTADIAYIVSEHRVNHMYTLNGSRFWTPEALDRLQRRLDPQQFFRIHRSSIVNLSASFEIEPWEDGRLKLHFTNGATLTAARDPAKVLREKYGF